jgi:alpha-tubulin suppressor-like RCC1 family protein
VPKHVLSLQCVATVAAGSHHTILALTSGKLYTCGLAVGGMLGHGGRGNELSPREVEAVTSFSVRVVLVAAGNQHSMAVTDAGRLLTFGFGRAGELGHGDKVCAPLPRFVAALEGVRVAGSGEKTTTRK